MRQTTTARTPSPRARRFARRLRVHLWRRRHLLAAAALGLAAVLAVHEIRPAPPPTEPAVVLSAPRPAGALLGPTDLVIRPVPDGFLPSGALRDPLDALGARLAVGLPAGFPLVDGVLVGPRLASAAPPGSVVVPLRLADPDVAALLDAGDRVDILQAPPDGGAARLVARNLLVMARTTPSAARTDLVAAADAPLLLVAATREVATLLVGAGAWDPISAVLVGDVP